jgi:hypothetical protein
MNVLSGGGLSIIPAALVVAAAVFFGLAAVMAIFVVIVVANRADPDPTGRRPVAVSLLAVAFFSIFVVLFGSFAIVLGLVQLIGSHSATATGAIGVEHPVGDAVARVVVLGGIIVAVASVLLLASTRRALSFPEIAQGQPGPVARVAQSYAASVSFVCVMIAAASLVVSVYEVFRIVAPGVFELTGSRVDAVRVLLAALYLTLAAATVVVAHARLMPGGGWRRPPHRGGGPRYGEFAPPPPPPPPPPV